MWRVRGLAVDLFSNGLGGAAGIASGQGGIAEGGDHPLTRLVLARDSRLKDP